LNKPAAGDKKTIRNIFYGRYQYLLFHNFVDSDSVLLLHFIELVDATDAAIGEHEGASFENELVSDRIFLNNGGQTNTG
jgi:hypothetical protein